MVPYSNFLPPNPSESQLLFNSVATNFDNINTTSLIKQTCTCTTRPDKHGRVDLVFCKKKKSYVSYGTRNTRPCVTGHPVIQTVRKKRGGKGYCRPVCKKYNFIKLALRTMKKSFSRAICFCRPLISYKDKITNSIIGFTAELDPLNSARSV